MFTKGMGKIAGRRRGTPNKLTASFREAVLTTFENIGGTDGLTTWASENPMEFYKIAARLIPTEIKCSEGRQIRVIVNRDGALPAEPSTTLKLHAPNAVPDGRE